MIPNAIFGAIGAFGTPSQQSMANNAYAQNQAAFHNAAIQHQRIGSLGQGKVVEKPEWMFNGKVMDLVGFANAVFGEDTPEATCFVLKYSK